MKSILFTIIGLLMSAFVFGQSEAEMKEYNAINTELITGLEGQLHLYDSLDTSSPKSIKAFVKTVSKNSKSINKTFKRKMKLAKSIRKNEKGTYQIAFDYCSEEDRSQEYFHESLDQLIIRKNADFVESKEESVRSLSKSLYNVQDEYKYINSQIQKRK
jgi:hypothetical protein